MSAMMKTTLKTKYYTFDIMTKLWEILCKVSFATWGFFAPLHAIFTVLLLFIGIDFITGVWASYARAERAGEPWAFRSDKARTTAAKLLFVIVGVILAWLLDTTVIPSVDFHLAQLLTGYVCAVEFWSFLENGADIVPDTAVFRVLRKVMAKEVKEKTGVDIEQTIKGETDKTLKL